MRTVKTKVYQFNELSDDAKNKVLDKFRDYNVDFDWWTFQYDWFKERSLLDVTDIFFDLNTSDVEFGFRSCQRLFEQWVEGKNKLSLLCNLFEDSAKKCNSLRYPGSLPETFLESPYSGYPNLEGFLEKANDEFSSYLDDYYTEQCAMLQKSLREEYEYQTSDEAIKEMIEANEYEFLSDGTLYHN